MAKYTDVLRDVEQVFASKDTDGNQTTWGSYKIATRPANYQGGKFADEFVHLEVIPGAPLTNYAELGVSGQIIVQIYTRAGTGSMRAMQIADNIDNVLQGRRLTRGTITGTSSLAFLGIDNDDNSLFRADYSVAFRHY